MSKKASTLPNMLLALVVIAVVAAGALAAVYAVTKGPIEEQQQNKVKEAIVKVLPGFDNQKGNKNIVHDTVTAIDGDKHDVIVHCAYINDTTLFGAAVETYTDKAFGGEFTIMVGFDAEGNVIGTSVIKAAETPGLGDKIKSDEFAGQFDVTNKSKYNNKLNPRSFGEKGLTVKKDGGEVDAITAATISSRAFCDAVNRAAKGYDKILEKKGVSK